MALLALFATQEHAELATHSLIIMRKRADAGDGHFFLLPVGAQRSHQQWAHIKQASPCLGRGSARKSFTVNSLSLPLFVKENPAWHFALKSSISAKTKKNQIAFFCRLEKIIPVVSSIQYLRGVGPLSVCALWSKRSPQPTSTNAQKMLE